MSCHPLYPSNVEIFVDIFLSLCRCEIEATLERLKKLERDLSTKEQELKERERRLKMWERKLIEQSNSPVSSSSSPLFTLVHLHPQDTTATHCQVVTATPPFFFSTVIHVMCVSSLPLRERQNSPAPFLG